MFASVGLLPLGDEQAIPALHDWLRGPRPRGIAQ
jgi:hypothetical protein